jgi:hypothetical protein
MFQTAQTAKQQILVQIVAQDIMEVEHVLNVVMLNVIIVMPPINVLVVIQATLLTIMHV